MWGKRNTPPLLGGVQTCTVALEISMMISQKIRKKSTSSLSIYPKDVQSYYKDICSTMFIATLLVIGKTWKQSRCFSTEEWIKKMWYSYTTEYYSAVKNNDILKFAGKWM